MKRNLLDEDLCRALNQNPQCYLDPDTERDASYGTLKRKCKIEPHTGLMLLPLADRKDPSKLMFDGVRKPVSAQQLLECGVLDKPTFNKLIKGEKTVPEVSVDKKIFLKGTGSIAGVTVGSLENMSLSEAKKQMLMPPESADLLLEAQAATGYIIDPISNQKLTVEEACARGVVERSDQDNLLAAEAAAVGYKDPRTGQSLSVFEAIKKGLIDKKTGVRLLQAQESAGGILDPNLSVFLPKETAMKRNLLDEDLCRALNQNPQCYLDPDTERDASYGTLKRICKIEPHTGLMLLPLADRKDPSKLMFDGVRKPVSAQQLLECGVLDKPTFNKLIKGEKTVPEVSVDKKIFLKGTGSIAGVTVGSLEKMSLSEAKKLMLMPPESADLLLEAQAATGHITDPISNQKLTVEEACARGVVERSDQDNLLAAEAAAVGYKDPRTGQSLSVFEAIKKGLIDKKTGVRLLQAQESAGGILDPNLSVFLPKETAMKRNLLDEDLCRALNQNPQCYLDPDTERDASYGTLKRICKIEPHTGLMLLPLADRKDPSKLMFDGVRKPVSAQQLLECGVLDKPTFNKLIKGEKTVPEVSVDKKIFLKGTGSIAGVTVGSLEKMSLSEAKKLMLMPPESADLLLEAQAATGHITDPISNQKLTVEEACARGVVERSDQDKLLAAEAAAVGYKDPRTGQSLSVFEAIKKGLIDKKTGVRLLQAQESAGGILDPNLSVFLPKETAMKRNLLDEDLCRALNQNPECYLDPDTERDASYGALKRKCKIDPHTGLVLLPLADRKDPSKLMFDGVRKPVSAQQLLECGVLDKPAFNKLIKGEKTVPEVSVDKKIFLKGTGSIAGVTVGSLENMSLSEAKKQMLMPPESADLLLEAQAATGYIIDPISNQKLTVEEACARGVVERSDQDNLLAAEAAAVGYKDPRTGQSLSVFEAIKKGLIDKKTGVRLLQAQESAGGILDPNLSVFLPKETAMKRNLLDEDLCRALNQNPECYLDPDTERDASYGALKRKCKIEPHTGLVLLALTEKTNPSKLMFDGLCAGLDKKKQESSQNNTVRKRRVIIVVPETDKEMTVHEAYNKGYIDYDTYLELSEQECEWEEITITAPDGSMQYVIIDRRTGRQYDIDDLLEKRVIEQSDVEQYRSHAITITQFAEIISYKTKHKSSSLSSSLSSSSNLTPEPSGRSSVTPSLSLLGTTSQTSKSLCSSSPSSTSRTSEVSVPASFTSPSLSSSSSTFVSRPLSPTFTKTTTTKTTTMRSLLSSTIADFSDSQKHVSSASFSLSLPLEAVGEVEPVGAVFDTETVEKISITEALNRGLVDSITAQRLLEAQACTGGIVNPTNGKRLSIQEASRMAIITHDMVTKLKPAQKAYFGFEDMKTNRKLSAAQAMKEMWLPYEAGQRFLEFQVATGGLYDPEKGCRRSIEDALKIGWIDVRAAHKLQDIKHHTKNLTCPKSKLKVSYKELLDNCLVEEGTGVKMLHASLVSSRGISSPYNVASAPGSTPGSKSGSQRGSRRSSVDLGYSLPQYRPSYVSEDNDKLETQRNVTR
ncbi:hypothetical protein CRENBAI_020136 [Crenichthys baileyi]|uniref:Desmoplakin n=1 Tax=Crenichthys baileyi TaxID=28760 RepID=A0AAV9SK76_9TELE